eukprot:6208015-Pleurochrysis_carterae.AAC.3
MPRQQKEPQCKRCRQDLNRAVLCARARALAPRVSRFARLVVSLLDGDAQHGVHGLGREAVHGLVKDRAEAVAVDGLGR